MEEGGRACSQEDAEGDSGAVGEVLEVGEGLDGVAKGVAEVEERAEAAVVLICGDDAGLEGAAGVDQVGVGLGVVVLEGLGAVLQVREGVLALEEGVLEDLPEAGGQLAWGEGAEEARSADDADGLMEGADEVLGAADVDGGLAADGGVHHGEERGGELEAADAAEGGGGCEAREVADDAAAEGDEDVIAPDVVLDEPGPDLREDLGGLGAFAGADGEVEEVPSGALEAVEDALGVRFGEAGVAEDEEAGGGRLEGAEAEIGQLGGALGAVGGDPDGVGALLERDGDALAGEVFVGEGAEEVGGDLVGGASVHGEVEIGQGVAGLAGLEELLKGLLGGGGEERPCGALVRVEASLKLILGGVQVHGEACVAEALGGAGLDVGAAAEGDDEWGSAPGLHQFKQRLSLNHSEGGLPLSGEELVQRLTHALGDGVIEVDEGEPQDPGEDPSGGGLTCAHHPGEEEPGSWGRGGQGFLLSASGAWMGLRRRAVRAASRLMMRGVTKMRSSVRVSDSE